MYVIKGTVQAIVCIHLCTMNFLKRAWARFKAKSNLAKAGDIIFVLLLVMMISADGRILLQRAILVTGIFSNVDINEDQVVSHENWMWTIVDEYGVPHRLSEFKGKTVFMNFWATWCPPCIAEMPYILELAEEAPDDVVFLLVTSEKPERVEPFLKSKDWTVPVFYLSYYPATELAFKSLPTTFIINPEGKVIHKSEGMKQWNGKDARKLLGM